MIYFGHFNQNLKLKDKNENSRYLTCRRSSLDMLLGPATMFGLVTRDERTRVSDVCPCPSPCPRFSDMPVSEPVSVSEVMTLSESVSESASEVQKNLVSVSEPASEIEFFYLSESVSESMSELLSEPMPVSESEFLSESSDTFEYKEA